jgi:hypothetical protein
MLLSLPDAVQRHVLVFVSLRDLRSVKAVCKTMLRHARITLRDGEWLINNREMLGLIEGSSSSSSSADGPDVVGDISNFVDFTAPFTPAPAIEPAPATMQVELRACTACGQRLSKDSFSKKQWKKEERRCVACSGNASHRPRHVWPSPKFLQMCVSDLRRPTRRDVCAVRRCGAEGAPVHAAQ